MGREQEVTIQREVILILILLYMAEILILLWDVKEKVHSLLSFDVVEADKPISEELKQEIEKDGVIIYEKA